MTLVAPAIIIVLFVKGALAESQTTIIVAVGWAFLSYILSFVWAISAVDDYNHKILLESSQNPEHTYIGESKEQIYENLERIKRLRNDKILDDVQYEKQKVEYLARLKHQEELRNSLNYQAAFEREFSSDNNSSVQNWVIAFLLLALLFSVYFFFIK